MDDAAREAAIQSLLRDSDAVPESLEIVRARRVGDRVTVLARWIEAPTGRSRCGALDVVMTDGLWRAGGGWSAKGNHGSDHKVWGAWGSTSRATSGWVSDPAACTVRFRGSHGGQVDADTMASTSQPPTIAARRSSSSTRPAAFCTPSRSAESSRLDNARSRRSPSARDEKSVLEAPRVRTEQSPAVEHVWLSARRRR